MWAKLIGSASALHGDWFGAWHVTQAGPMKVSLGVLGEWLRKRSSLSKEMTNCKADGILETGATGTGPA